MYALRSVRGGGPAIEKSRCGEIRNPHQEVCHKSHPALEEEDECPGCDGKQVIGADESGSQTRRRRCHGSRDLMCTHIRYFLTPGGVRFLLVRVGPCEVPGLRPYRYALGLWGNGYLSKTAVLRFIGRVIRQLVRCTQFLGDLAKIAVGGRLLSVKMRAASFLGDAIH